MISRLRIFAFVEGFSLLTLLFVAMPMKYYFEMPLAVTYVGWVHGLLFMGFVWYASEMSRNKYLPDKLLLPTIISSMLPFGMFVMDRTLKRHQNAAL